MPSRPARILSLIVLSVFLVRLDSSIVNISLPTMAVVFNASASEVSRIALAYLLLLSSTLLIAGQCVDHYGYRRIFTTGYAIFLVGSLGCGLAPTLEWLIAARAVQGIGGALLAVTLVNMLLRLLPVEQQGLGFGLFTMANGLGLALGSPLGGMIVEYGSWPWLYWLNIPLGLATLALARRWLPTDRQPPPSEPLDWLGVPLSMAAIIGVVYALNLGQERGWTSPVILASLTGGGIAGWAFIVHERRVACPLLDFALLRNRVFTWSALAGVLVMILFSGSNFLFPFYLQTLQDLSASAAGVFCLAFSVCYVLTGPIAGWLSDRITAGRLCLIGLLSAAAAGLFFTVLLPGTLPLALIFLVWLAASFGLFMPVNNRFTLAAAAPEQAGMAISFFNIALYLGQMLGVLLFETLLSMALPDRFNIGSYLAQDHTHLAAALIRGFQSSYGLGIGLSLAAALCMGIAVRCQRCTP